MKVTKEMLKRIIKEELQSVLNEDKQKQLEIIQTHNPMRDDYHVGIRTVQDIKSAEEVWETNVDFHEDFLYPDFSQQDAKKALESGKIKVYSSYSIKQGTFVSPSRRMAMDYAGGKEPFSKVVDIDDVAWINSDEGQYAKYK